MSDHPWDHAPDIMPGGKICFVRGDEVWTQTVESVTHTTQPYVLAPPLSWRQRVLRRITPRRWRKPLPQPSGGLPVVTIKTTEPLWTRET